MSILVIAGKMCRFTKHTVHVSPQIEAGLVRKKNNSEEHNAKKLEHKALKPTNATESLHQ